MRTAEQLSAEHQAEFRPRLVDATNELHSVGLELEVIIKRGSYSVAEVRVLRKRLLGVVRNDLDPMLGHMPAKRHY